MLGGDFTSSEFENTEPPPGRALVFPHSTGEGDPLTIVTVRFTDDGAAVTRHLTIIAAPAELPAVTHWASIIVVLASHPGDIRTAIDVARTSGWIPVALSPATDYPATGYAIGLGVSTQ